MIVDRYDPVDLFELVPTKLRLEMEPELSQIDRLLEDDELFLRIKADFSKRRPNSERLGRRSTPVEVILRMLVLRRLYDWSFEATERHVSDSLVLRQFEHHRQRLGKPPRLVAADRGMYSPDNEGECRKRGIERVCLPKPGKKSQQRREHERQGWFRRGMRFRAGIEGRISVSKRRGFLGRCRDKGEEGFDRWVGWGVICSNLSTIARKIATR